jgi:hypothetical protein
MAHGLTSKQMLFAEKVASGLSFSQAYREAYKCQRSKPSTIRTDASRLARMPKIVQAIQNSKRKRQWQQLVLADSRLAEPVFHYTQGTDEAVRLKSLRRIGKLTKMC